MLQTACSRGPAGFCWSDESSFKDASLFNDRPAVADFSARWMACQGRQIGDATARVGIVKTLGTLIHAGLQCSFQSPEKTFFLEFFLRESKGGDSPVAMFNTKVAATDADNIYPAVLRLLASVVPTGTELVTFVRQDETLKILEEDWGPNLNMKMLPLVQMFESSAWKFLSLKRIEGRPARRSFMIRFATTETGD